jgi:anion-transporting  ArsA/GET3 family ATPase
VTPLRPASLLERRLVIVTGKGGTGKTTVAAALAVAAAGTGRRVLLAEVGRDEQIPSRFEPGSPPAGYAGREVHPGVTAMRIDPFEALGEYLALQLGVSAPVALVLRNRAFRQLMEAAPGWRELITLGKVWHLEQMQAPSGRARWDLIVVDAPATGHGVTFLSAPRVVVSALRAGPLRRHAAQVEALVEDPVRTALLPVALAEELPVRETEELVRNVQREVGISVDRVVVNAVLPRPFPPGLEDLDERLRRLPEGVPLGALPSPGVLAACAGHLRARWDLHERWARALAESTGLPCVRLPYLAGGVEGAASLAALGAALLADRDEEAA